MSLSSAQIGGAAQAIPPGKASFDEVYGKLTLAAAVFFVTLEASYLLYAGVPHTLAPWVDSTHFVLGRDFLTAWMGGRSLFFGGPAPWFDLQVYNAALREMLGTEYPAHFWSYPPHVVLFTWPFGLMPYLPAYFAWCAIGIALYLFVCSKLVPRQRLLFLAVAPSIAVCIFFGQNGFYTAALLTGGMLCRERRPALAGVLFGILSIKPQLGLLLPVVLLLERRWLTIAAAAATVAALVTITALLFGWDVWAEFWHKVVPQQQWLTQHGGGLLYAAVSSVYFGGRLMHLPPGADWAIQAVVSLLALAAVTWTYWKPRDPALSLALFITATFLFTPYILNYDMVVLGLAAALLLARADNTPADHWLIIAVWTLPVAMMIAAVAHVPLAPIVLIAFACRLLWRLAQDGRAAAPLPAPAASAFA
jgi:alpha-1,2-mannosyltransferase